MLFSDISVAVAIADIVVSRFLRNMRYSILTRRRNPERVWKLTRDIKKIAVLLYFLLENVKKHVFLETLSAQLILLFSSFPRKKLVFNVV